MGARGPAPKPKALLTSWRADARPDEVSFPVGPPPCPAVLSGPARKEWRRVAKLLAGAGVLQTADLAVLAAYCRSWGEWLRLTELSAGWDFASEGDRKQARLLAQTEQRLSALAGQLGLSPAARTRVQRPDAGIPPARVETRIPTAADLQPPPK